MATITRAAAQQAVVQEAVRQHKAASNDYSEHAPKIVALSSLTTAALGGVSIWVIVAASISVLSISLLGLGIPLLVVASAALIGLGVYYFSGKEVKDVNAEFNEIGKEVVIEERFNALAGASDDAASAAKTYRLWLINPKYWLGW
jgi:hypothetical protein